MTTSYDGGRSYDDARAGAVRGQPVILIHVAEAWYRFCGFNPIYSARYALRGDPSALRPAGQTLFAQATNYGPTATTRRMDIYLDDTLFNAYNLTLDPAREHSIVIGVPAQVRQAEARLVGGSQPAPLPA